MNQDDIRRRIADHLDGLLEGEEDSRARADIRRHPDLHAEALRQREILHRPYAIPPPPPDLAERILSRSARRPPWRVLRYAAAFVAGILATLLVQTGRVEPKAQPIPEPQSETIVNLRLR
jgi:ferric-dicitrate binding protein FerR (iron transport regulator)